MEIPWQDDFLEEANRWNLKFTCEDCANFDSEKETCTHHFPTFKHRRPYWDGKPRNIVFCKDFELV